MAVWVLPIFVFLGCLIVVGLTIFIIIKMSRSTAKIDIMPNAPIIDMTTRRHFTKGYVLGVVRRAIPNKNKTVLFEIHPIDPEQGENKPRPPIIPLVVGMQFLKFYAKGERSSRRDYIQILSRDPTDLPEKMRETQEGDFLKVAGQKAWLERTFGKMIPAGDEAIHEAMRVYHRGNIAKATMAQIRDEAKEIKNLFSITPDKKDESKK